MIKALFGMDMDDDDAGILIGLSAKNIERLKAGEPIFVNDSGDKWPIKMIIMYGETEDDIIIELKKKGTLFGFPVEPPEGTH